VNKIAPKTTAQLRLFVNPFWRKMPLFWGVNIFPGTPKRLNVCAIGSWIFGNPTGGRGPATSISQVVDKFFVLLQKNYCKIKKNLPFPKIFYYLITYILWWWSDLLHKM
jgi:hypothetical protein